MCAARRPRAKCMFWKHALRPTVYVSPAQETSPECPAGPSITGLDVVTAMLLPLLCETVSPPALCNSPSGMAEKERGRGQLLPISDHKSSSTAFLASALRSSDWGGSDHLSTRRKLNLRRVPPGVDPATRSAAMRCPTTKPYCRSGKDRRGPMITHGSSNCFPPIPRDLKTHPASGGHPE